MLNRFRKPSSEIVRHSDQWAFNGGFHSPFYGSTVGSVGDTTALALPAYYRGVHIRADLISTLPLALQVGDQTQDFTAPIVEQPDPTEDRQTTISRLAASLTMRGEFVAVLGGFDSDGFPQALKVVDPLEAYLEDNGSWRIGTRAYAADEILHRMSLSLPGQTRGINSIELFRRTLAADSAARNYQENFYMDGGMPPAVVTVNRTEVSPTTMEAVAAAWRDKMNRRREPVFLPGDMSVTPLVLTNQDAQFIETRQFALTDIANIVGLPPYFVGAQGSSNTYSNVQDQNRQLYDIYLRKDLYVIEQALTSLIPDPYKVKFDAKSFLRLDPKATADTLHVQAEWMTIDEIRAVQGLQPLPNGQGNVLAASLLPGAPQQGGNI